METLYLVMDDSGAKGYADVPESKPGEFGVMSGYLVLARDIGHIRSSLTAVCARWLHGDKIHIAGLPSDQQQQLRDAVFKFFQDQKIRCIYEAIYVQGFFENGKRLAALVERAKSQRKSPIKLSRNEKIELLHVELFSGLLSKAVAFGQDHFGTNSFGIEIITDPVDAPVVKQFEAEARHYLDIGNPHIYRQTGFDPRTNSVVEGQFTIQVEGRSQLIDDLSGVRVAIHTEFSALTLAADVLSNSVHYYLRGIQNSNFGCPLNEKITGHPLEPYVFGTQSNYIFDLLYKHPGV